MRESVSGIACLFVIAVGCLAGCGGGSGGNGGGGGGGGGGTPTTVTYTFKQGIPTAVATKVGTGAFTQASLQSGVLTFTVPSGSTNYSLAYVCPVTSQPISFQYEYVIEASTLDGASHSSAACPISPVGGTPGLATLQVDASAIAGAGSVAISGGINGSVSLPWTNGALAFSGNLTSGTYDVFVVVFDPTGTVPLAVRILRTQTVPGALNGGSPVVFTASDATTTQTITYQNAPAGFLVLAPQVQYLTAGGQDLTLDALNLTAPTTQYAAVPTGAVQSGDSYIVNSSAFNGGGLSEQVAVFETTTSGGPLTITYPTPWAYSGPTAAALPTFNYDYTGFAGKSQVVQYLQLSWGQLTSSESIIGMSATANYQNGATSLTFPDLSGLKGFIAPPASGTEVQWLAGIEQGTATSASSTTQIIQSVANHGLYGEP
jgi:hypothetical protein